MPASVSFKPQELLKEIMFLRASGTPNQKLIDIFDELIVIVNRKFIDVPDDLQDKINYAELRTHIIEELLKIHSDVTLPNHIRVLYSNDNLYTGSMIYCIKSIIYSLIISYIAKIKQIEISNPNQ
jgi:hypothetical protein